MSGQSNFLNNWMCKTYFLISLLAKHKKSEGRFCIDSFQSTASVVAITIFRTTFFLLELSN